MDGPQSNWRNLFRWIVVFLAAAVLIYAGMVGDLSVLIVASRAAIAKLGQWMGLSDGIWLPLLILLAVIAFGALSEIAHPHWNGIGWMDWWEDFVLVIGAIVAERIPALIVICVALILGHELATHASEEFICKKATAQEPIPASAERFFTCLARFDFDEGRAALVSAAVTIGLALFGYFMRLRARRLHTARAILAEITVKHEGNGRSAAGADRHRLSFLVRQVPPIRLIAVVDDAKSHMLSSQADGIALLPRILIRPIAEFYQSDSFVAASLKALDGEAFHAADPSRRAAYLGNFFAMIDSDYLPVARRAHRRLGLYCQACRWLPI